MKFVSENMSVFWWQHHTKYMYMYLSILHEYLHSLKYESPYIIEFSICGSIWPAYNQC